MAKTNDERRASSEINPMDIAFFVPYVCSQLGASFNVKIVIRVQEEYVSKVDGANKKLKKSLESTSCQPQVSSTQDESSVSPDNSGLAKSEHDTETILLTLVNDTIGRLIEIYISRCASLPRLLIQILAMCVPYQVHLIRLTINWVKIDGATLYEIGKLFPVSNLTELCLDDAPVTQRNYSVILESSNLKRLSLNRCDIDDVDCTAIANHLMHPLAASKSLLILSLVSNLITDVGALALGYALRSNRSLKYLNISGNNIHDEGAIAILKSLMTFNLSSDEVILKSKRFFDYLKLRKAVFAKCHKELLLAAEMKLLDEYSQSSKKKTNRARVASKASVPGWDPVYMKAETMTNELVGFYFDPFSKDEIIFINGHVHCLGNMTLCSLNISCNYIGYLTIAKLAEVLVFQSGQINRGTGLIRVAFEINDTPEACAELDTIQQILEQILTASIKNVRTTKRVKSKFAK